MKKLYTKRWFERRLIPVAGGWVRNMHAAGLLYNPGAWWIGVHYSPGNRRFCINLIPCLTVWYTMPGGNEP